MRILGYSVHRQATVYKERNATSFYELSWTLWCPLILAFNLLRLALNNVMQVSNIIICEVKSKSTPCFSSNAHRGAIFVKDKPSL